MVSQLVGQHAAESEKNISRKSDQQIANSMFRWIWWGVIVIGLGMLMLVTGKTLLNMKVLDPVVAGWLRLISLYLLLGGAGMPVFGVLKALRQGAPLSPGRRSTPLTEAVDTNQLPTNPIPEALPSVTERTTQLISVDDATKTKVEVK